jgi:murein L,D-transpeptidase YcbB/YkuD
MPIRRESRKRPDEGRFGLGALLAVFALFLAAGILDARNSAARAQNGNWWEGIQSLPPGFSDKSRDPPPSGPRQDTLNDLRPDDIPWRSDEMLTSVDKAIDLYQRIVSKGGWPLIPGNRMLRPGDDDERVAALRRRLRATGELAGSGYDDYSFDSAVEAAVVRFQEHNGLRASGRVDQPTLAALNITAEERLAQLKLNRGRIAELMQSPPEERYVLVNVPAFQLEAVERYSVALRHRVIVGRPERETPSLKATIKALNFFPYWKVPDSVAQLDVIPRLQKEPDYLAKEQIRVIAGDFNGHELDPNSIDWFQASASKIKFRQDPGPQNALGLVRIDMQNEHGVYMHDTPMKPLFQQRSRPFSAGCVRVQDVFQLVEWIARFEPGWEQPGRVRAVLEQGQALDLALTRPVPVYFTYITAWAEASGQVEFRPDIYKRDGAQAVAEVYDPEAPPPPQQGFAP